MQKFIKEPDKKTEFYRILYEIICEFEAECKKGDPRYKDLYFTDINFKNFLQRKNYLKRTAKFKDYVH